MLRTLILGGERPVVTPYTIMWVIRVSFLPPFLSISSCSASTDPCRLPPCALIYSSPGPGSWGWCPTGQNGRPRLRAV